ncbi:T9SS type A sorting domain-containing protein [bacterium]|nr:T9SS type A sorting domain-containing protein [bacterium]
MSSPIHFKRIILSLLILLLCTSFSYSQDSLNISAVASMYDFWFGVVDMAVNESIAFLSTGSTGLKVINFADPDNIEVLYEGDPFQNTSNLQLVGNRLFVLTDGIKIFDISDPSDLVPVDHIEGNFTEFYYSEDILFAIYYNRTDDEKFLHIYEQERDHMNLRGSILLADQYRSFSSIQSSGTTLYFTSTRFGDNLYAVDFHDFENINISTFDFGELENLVVYNNYLIANIDYENLLLFDISEPLNPTQVDIDGLVELNENLITIQNDLLYTGRYGIIYVYELDNLPNVVLVGQITPPDNYDFNYISIVGDSLIYKMNNGFKIFDISEYNNPALIIEYLFGGGVSSGALYDQFLLCSPVYGGVASIDISNPLHPLQFNLVENFHFDHIQIQGDYAFTSESYIDNYHYNHHFNITDLSDLPETVPLFNGGEQGEFDRFQVAGDRIYTLTFPASAGAENYFLIMDISDIQYPDTIGFYRTPSSMQRLIVDDNIAYVTEYDNLLLLDLTDETNPTVLSRLPIDVFFDMTLHDNYLYIQAYRYPLENQETIIDVSDPQNPQILYQAPIDRYYSIFDFSGDYMYKDIGRYISILDVSDPLNPIETGFYETSGSAFDLIIDEPYLYVMDGSQLLVLDCSEAIDWNGVPQQNTKTPATISIGDAYPNPFNATLSIPFSIQQPGKVDISLYNLQGQTVFNNTQLIQNGISRFNLRVD